MEADYLENVLALLAKHLPNLFLLHIGLKTTSHQHRRVDPAALYAPLDAYVRQNTPRLGHFTVSISYSVFQQLFETARSQIINQQGVNVSQLSYMADEFWRNLDGNYVTVPIPQAKNLYS